MLVSYPSLIFKIFILDLYLHNWIFPFSTCGILHGFLMQAVPQFWMCFLYPSFYIVVGGFFVCFCLFVFLLLFCIVVFLCGGVVVEFFNDLFLTSFWICVYFQNKHFKMFKYLNILKHIFETCFKIFKIKVFIIHRNLDICIILWKYITAFSKEKISI